jgi:hypothetical protein
MKKLKKEKQLKNEVKSSIQEKGMNEWIKNKIQETSVQEGKKEHVTISVVTPKVHAIHVRKYSTIIITIITTTTSSWGAFS